MRSFKLKSHLLLLISLSFIAYSFIFTGPSSLESLIRPISMNEKGEILCRTKFTQNKMGAHRPMEISYGYGIISPDTFVQIETALIDPDGYPDYKDFYKHKEYWDSVFLSCFDPAKIGLKGYLAFQGYNFEGCNVSACRVDKDISLEAFEKERQIDLEKSPQKALHGAISESYFKERKIRYLYDFGYVQVLENIRTSDGFMLGAEFSYFNPWKNEYGEFVNKGFDDFKVTGMLFLE